METWVVSLKTSEERKKSFDERMKGLINYTYFEACTPAEIGEFAHYFANSNIYEYNEWYIPEAVIACAKSHFQIWKESIAMDKSIFVLEDDAEFINERAVELFQQLELPDEFDVFYLDGITVDEPFRVIWPIDFHLTHSYIVSPHGAKILVEEVERNGFKAAVDWQMNWMYMQPGLFCSYAVSIPIFRQSGSISNIIRHST